MRVALLYEHPTWSGELLSKLAERSIEVTAIDVGNPDHESQATQPHDLWINRINAMPSEGRSAAVSARGCELLASLTDRGETIFNGLRAHSVGRSKLVQYELIAGLGLHTPQTVGIGSNDSELISESGRRLGFPLLTKPNVGGSGAGIARFNTATELRAAATAQTIDLGPDETGVIQQIITSGDGFVHRIEMLNGELFYATRQAVQDGVYNYCAADGCAIAPGSPRPGSIEVGLDQPSPIEVVEADPDIVAQVASIVKAAEADIAGVEYLLDQTNGRPCFYDINPYSNFISGQNERLGFDPIERFIDVALASVKRR